MTTTPPPGESDVDAPWLSRIAVALTHRHFRLLWIAALGSTIGTWMQKYAQSLLVLRLTNSPFYLGLDDFLSQLPIILFMLIGGVVADRYNRRRLLTGSQYIQAFSAFTLASLVFTHHISIWFVLALSFISGCGQAFGGPAYQSMIPSLVPRRDLPNAIALNSTQFNLSRVLGPSAGGAVLQLFGMTACFALNGLSFFFVIAALAVIRIPPMPPTARQPLLDELKSGLNYVRNSRALVTLTVLVFMCTFLAMPIGTFVPIFASDIFGHGDKALAGARQAILMAAQGLGAIIGALSISSFSRRRMGHLLIIGQAVMGLLVAAFALSRSWPLSCALIFVCGFVFMGVFSISFSLVQLTVPDALRGRVISIYMVATRGGWPLGSLVAGSLAAHFTAPRVLMVNGLVLAVLSTSLLAFGRGRSLRQI